MNYNNITNIVNGFNKVLALSNVGKPPSVPTIIILAGVPRRNGLSPTKIAARIIARKSEAGLPVGALPTGGASPDEIMEQIRIEEIIKALQEEAKITVALPPGITVQASGISPAGPVTVVGASIKPFKGYAIIQ